MVISALITSRVHEKQQALILLHRECDMPLKKTAKNPEVAKHMVVISDPSAAADIGSIIILVKIEFILKLKPIYLIEVFIYLYFEGIEKAEYGYRNNYLL